MIIAYTGNGKGKTSAALGTVLRAAGYHLNSCIIQFIKDGSQYGEHHAINHHLNNFVEVYQGGIGFYKLPGDEHSEADHKKAASEAVKFTYKQIESKKYDIIVLDEILTAQMVDLVTEEEVLKIMGSIPDGIHLIVTGRGASDAIIEKSDLVTEMKEIKHPFQKNEPAVEGIDF